MSYAAQEVFGKPMRIDLHTVNQPVRPTGTVLPQM